MLLEPLKVGKTNGILTWVAKLKAGSANHLIAKHGLILKVRELQENIFKASWQLMACRVKINS